MGVQTPGLWVRLIGKTLNFGFNKCRFEPRSHIMYWIPLIPFNNNWTGLALPLPLPLNHTFNKNFYLATDKIFSSPSTDYNTHYFEDSLKVAPNSGFNGIKITLSGRLKGISKAKNFVFTQGVLKPQSVENKLDYYARPIFTKWGTLGLKLVIC